MPRKNILIIALITIAIIILKLTACHSSSTSQQKLVTVTKQPIITTAFYTGVIQPIKTTIITSPAEGIVNTTEFHYGDKVQSNQLLFTLNSEKFQTDYKAALTQFVKSKNEFINGQDQMKQAEFLHKNQLISDDEYKTKKSNFYGAELNLIQAQDNLSAFLKQLNIDPNNLFQLSIENITKMIQALHNQTGLQTLRITSSSVGIILLPQKNDGAQSENKKINQGDSIKPGQILAVIGDMSGIMININVNEFIINQLRLGQPVKVTSSAFPNMTLMGEVSGMDHQAEVNTNGLPTFSVQIKISTLTGQEQELIHAGMSAKVEITMQEPAQILAPITAVHESSTGTYVKVAIHKQLHEMPVQTGHTTENSVVILSGLHEGDQIAASY